MSASAKRARRRQGLARAPQHDRGADGPVVADRGADGPAMLARRSYCVPSDIAGLEYTQMADPSPLQGLRLSDRHHDALDELRRLWRASLPGMVRPRAFGRGDALDPDPDQAKEAAIAYRAYNDAITAVQWQAGLRAVMVLRAVAIHQEPTLETARLRDALDALALHLRV